MSRMLTQLPLEKGRKQGSEGHGSRLKSRNHCSGHLEAVATLRCSETQIYVASKVLGRTLESFSLIPEKMHAAGAKALGEAPR